MSYCRIGEDSDVYVWSDGHVWNTQVRWSKGAGGIVESFDHPLKGESYQDTTLVALKHRLRDIEAKGLRIPYDTFDRIEVELWSDD